MGFWNVIIVFCDLCLGELFFCGYGIFVRFLYISLVFGSWVGGIYKVWVVV